MGFLQMKNVIVGLLGFQEKCISNSKVGMTRTYTQTKMKSSLEALLREFVKNNTLDRL